MSHVIPLRRRSHTQTIRRWFGLAEGGPPGVVPRDLELVAPGAGAVMLIGGPSGSGKSSLLRRLLAQETRLVIAPDAIDLPARAVVDCFDSLRLRCILRLLSRCGLAEAWTYLQTPAELSEGQRWRLRLALALARAARADAPALLVVDEFAAVLDRVTAAVIARATRRLVDGIPRLALVCATSHEDLLEALAPDVHVTCDFGQVRVVHGRPGLDPRMDTNEEKRESKRCLL